MAGIDEIEPTVRYSVSTPGLMLGPDDIEGATLVPSESLTAAQRFFLMCIKPQQTLFPRRPVNEKWTSEARTVTDKNQRTARETYQRISRKRPCDAASPVLDHDLAVRGLVFDAAYLKTRVPKASDAWCRKRARLVGAQESGLFAPHVHVRTDSAMAMEYAATDMSIDAESAKEQQRQYEKWDALPHELLVRILCSRLGEALVSSHHEALDAIASLRAVSRGALALVDSFIGIQTSFLHESMQRSLNTSGRAEAPGALGMRMRSLGLGIVDVLRLRDHEVRLHKVRSWTLPKTPPAVPDWKWYMELRREAATRQGDNGVVNKPRMATTSHGDLFRVLARARSEEPNVWAVRFDAPDATQSSEYDALIAAAGELDMVASMHSLAGV